MSNGVVDELEKFGKYVKQQAKSNLSKRKKKDTSALYNGIEYKGNYQGCRSCNKVIKYCTKEDNYLSNFDVETRLKAR